VKCHVAKLYVRSCHPWLAVFSANTCPAKAGSYENQVERNLL